MAEFDAIPVTRLHGVVVKALEERILSGEIEPGSMLPPEKELAEQLGVGRRAVREALRVLQNKGLVDIRMGVGTIVLRNDMDSYLDTLLVNMSSYLQSNRGELEHVLEFREVIEGYALRRLIESRNESAIASLRSTIEAQRQAHRDADPEEYNRHHVAFHRLIVDSIGNPIVSMVYDQVRRLVAERMRVVGRSPEQEGKSIAEHVAIVDAVAAGDSTECDRAMRRHLALARKTLRSDARERVPAGRSPAASAKA